MTAYQPEWVDAVASAVEEWTGQWRGEGDPHQEVAHVALAAVDKAGLLLTQQRRLDLLGNPMGWTPEQIRRHEEFNASLRFEEPS